MATLTPNLLLSRDFHIWSLGDFGDQPSRGRMATLTKFACFGGESASLTPRSDAIICRLDLSRINSIYLSRLLCSFYSIEDGSVSLGYSRNLPKLCCLSLF
jgi:hypothetical protein